MSTNGPKVGDPIPATDHVIRYCSKNKWCPQNGLRFPPSTFQPAEIPDQDVSVNWLEYYVEDDAETRFKKAAIDCGHGNKRESGRFLKLNVEDIFNAARDKHNVKPKVLYSGHCENLSHADISLSNDPTYASLCLCADEYGEVLPVPVEALSSNRDR